MGFVWTRIEPNGRVSIGNKISEANIADFKEVLEPLRKVRKKEV